MKQRVLIRIPEGDEIIVEEFVQTISDRLCIRLNVDLLPSIFESICVDAVVKMYRRIYYEGITSEGAANISTTFVDDILAEYAQEIADWKEQQNNISGTDKVVSFI